MSIYAIVGNRGAGKTALLTYLLYQDAKGGGNIVSNYGLEFPHTQMSLSEMATLPDELQDATIGIDEFQMGADSRRAMSKENMKFTKFVTQVRKRGVVMYYTTQRFKLVDKRIRDQVDYTLLVEATDTPDYYKFQTIDRNNAEVISEKYFYGKPVYDLYNTNEIIEFD